MMQNPDPDLEHHQKSHIFLHCGFLSAVKISSKSVKNCDLKNEYNFFLITPIAKNFDVIRLRKLCIICSNMHFKTFRYSIEVCFGVNMKSLRLPFTELCPKMCFHVV